MGVLIKRRWLLVFAIFTAILIGLTLYVLTHQYQVVSQQAHIDKLRMPDGTVYSGELKNGLMHGQGTLTWPSGDEYTGGFAEGVLAGQGVLKTNGDEYRGEFVDGDLTGQGEFIGVDGGRYKGGFLRSEFNGPGEYTNEDGGKYVAEFTAGDLTGPGEYFGPDGEHYKGNFSYWRYDGEGVYTEKNGVYKGHFKHGLFDGEGRYKFSEHSDTPGKVLKGKWSWGEYIDPAKKEEQKAREFALESAIYQQDELLSSAAEKIKTSDTDKINLYFLGVAGYGRQDVFRKELEFIQPLFDARYNTSGRSLTLINDYATVTKVPLATPISIEKSLNALAGKMNPKKDILFIYLTSHGSASHHFSIDLQGISLPDLSADNLGDIIKKLPVKWKIITISACYSGGFIPHLESPDTLIMTAARKDRKSFGCGDTSEMTYFGRAFFQESLPGSLSFEDAFAQSQTLIDEWENELGDDVVHSLPQISMGKAIKEYLPRWWKQVPPASDELESQ